MRTTLTIDDDVLAAARARAVREHKTLGAVVSELARAGLRPSVLVRARNGLPVMPSRGIMVTDDLINRLREEVGD